jgi:hypothetical protein
MKRMAAWLRSLGLQVPGRREWIFVLIVAIGFMVVAAVPTWYGWRESKPLLTTGFGLYNNADVPSYLDLFWQVKDGHVLFSNSLTSEENPHVMLRPLFLTWGAFGKLFDLRPVITWQIARLFMTGVLTFVAYFFIAQFFRKAFSRRVAHLALLFSSGLALFFYFYPAIWQYFNLTQPSDMLVPESLTFLAHVSPLIAYSLSLMMLVVVFALFGWKRPWWSALIAGILSLLLIADHPYDAPILTLIGGALFVTSLIFRRHIKPSFITTAGMAVGVAAGAGLTFWSLSASPIISEWNEGNLLPVFPVMAYILGYAPLLPFAAYGVYSRWKSRVTWTLVIWFVGQFVLMYLPLFHFQRRLGEGLHIPLAILAAMGILALAKKGVMRYLLVLFISLSSIAQVDWLIIYNRLSAVDTIRPAYDYGYATYPESYAAGFQWLRDSTTEGDVVMSAMTNSSMITAFTGRRVLPGRWGQTSHFYDKIAQVEGYFNGALPLETFTENFGVTYVWIAREERKFMEQLGTTEESIMKGRAPIYRNSDVAIYDVR